MSEFLFDCRYLLETVYQALPENDRRSLGCVNRQANEVYREDRRRQTGVPGEYVRQVVENFPNTTSLSVVVGAVTNVDCWNDIVALLTDLRHLTELSLSTEQPWGVVFNPQEFFRPLAENLTDLTLQISARDFQSWFAQALEALPLIQSLHLVVSGGSVFILQPIECFPMLKRLSISLNVLTNTGQQLLFRCPGIQQLELVATKTTPFADGIVLNKLAPYGPSLTSLTLESSTKWDAFRDWSGLSVLPLLQSLNIDDCIHDSLAILSSAQFLEELQDLKLGICQSIHPDDMRQLGAMWKIKSLSFTNLLETDVNPIDSLLDPLANLCLESLSISDFPLGTQLWRQRSLIELTIQSAEIPVDLLVAALDGMHELKSLTLTTVVCSDALCLGLSRRHFLEWLDIGFSGPIHQTLFSHLQPLSRLTYLSIECGGEFITRSCLSGLNLLTQVQYLDIRIPCSFNLIAFMDAEYIRLRSKIRFDGRCIDQRSLQILYDAFSNVEVLGSL